MRIESRYEVRCISYITICAHIYTHVFTYILVIVLVTRVRSNIPTYVKPGHLYVSLSGPCMAPGSILLDWQPLGALIVCY